MRLLRVCSPIVDEDLPRRGWLFRRELIAIQQFPEAVGHRGRPPRIDPDCRLSGVPKTGRVLSDATPNGPGPQGNAVAVPLWPIERSHDELVTAQQHGSCRPGVAATAAALRNCATRQSVPKMIMAGVDGDRA
jgi:hypothetical protein